MPKFTIELTETIVYRAYIHAHTKEEAYAEAQKLLDEDELDYSESDNSGLEIVEE